MTKNKETICNKDKDPSRYEARTNVAKEEMKKLGYTEFLESKNDYALAKKDGEVHTLKMSWGKSERRRTVEGERCVTVEDVKIELVSKGRETFDQIIEIGKLDWKNNLESLLDKSSREVVNHRSAQAELDRLEIEWRESEERMKQWNAHKGKSMQPALKEEYDEQLRAHNTLKAKYEAAKTAASAEAAKPKTPRPKLKLAENKWTPAALQVALGRTNFRIRELKEMIANHEEALKDKDGKWRVHRKELREGRVILENHLRLHLAVQEKLIGPKLRGHGYTLVDTNGNYFIASKGKEIHTFRTTHYPIDGRFAIKINKKESAELLSTNRKVFDQMLEVQDIFRREQHLSLAKGVAEKPAPKVDVPALQTKLASIETKLGSSKATLEGFKEIEAEFGGIPDYIKEDYDKVKQEVTTLNNQHTEISRQIKQASSAGKAPQIKAELVKAWEEPVLREMGFKIAVLIRRAESDLKTTEKHLANAEKAKSELQGKAKSKIAQLQIRIAQIIVRIEKTKQKLTKLKAVKAAVDAQLEK